MNNLVEGQWYYRNATQFPGFVEAHVSPRRMRVDRVFADGFVAVTIYGSTWRDSPDCGGASLLSPEELSDERFSKLWRLGP